MNYSAIDISLSKAVTEKTFLILKIVFLISLILILCVRVIILRQSCKQPNLKLVTILGIPYNIFLGPIFSGTDKPISIDMQ